MDKYKLYNSIKRDLVIRHKFKKSDIQLRGFSYSLLRELFQKYAVQEYVVSDYCCRGEDHCCWQEVEGETFGWIWLTKGGISRHFALEKSLYDSLKRYKKELYSRKIFYIDTCSFIWVEIPLRDVAKSDFTIIFDKTKPVKDLQNNNSSCKSIKK